MRRGTTPTHKFTVPVDLRTAESVFITYKQPSGSRIIEKAKADMEISETEIIIELTQEDTLALSTIGNVEIQCRAKYPDGKAIASQIISVPVKKILKEGII